MPAQKSKQPVKTAAKVGSKPTPKSAVKAAPAPTTKPTSKAVEKPASRPVTKVQPVPASKPKASPKEELKKANAAKMKSRFALTMRFAMTPPTW